MGTEGAWRTSSEQGLWPAEAGFRKEKGRKAVPPQEAEPAGSKPACSSPCAGLRGEASSTPKAVGWTPKSREGGYGTQESPTGQAEMHWGNPASYLRGPLQSGRSQQRAPRLGRDTGHFCPFLSEEIPELAAELVVDLQEAEEELGAWAGKRASTHSPESAPFPSQPLLRQQSQASPRGCLWRGGKRLERR